MVRLLYPSCYYPASASKKGIIPSPVIARCIAFIAEFCLYEVWATWIDIPFWGNSNYLWLLVFVAECISTSGVLLQSELLLNVEDTLWCTHTIYMSYLSYPKHLGAACFFGLFGFYFVAFHLPMRYGLMFNRGKTISDQFKIDPLFFRSIFGFKSKSHLVKRCGEEEKMWVVPMLVG